MKCELQGCNKPSVGQILVTVGPDDEPWYISVCQEHLNGRKAVSPDGKPLVAGHPQWKDNQ